MAFHLGTESQSGGPSTPRSRHPLNIRRILRGGPDRSTLIFGFPWKLLGDPGEGGQKLAITPTGAHEPTFVSASS
jgi:hypothetical protein